MLDCNRFGRPPSVVVHIVYMRAERIHSALNFRNIRRVLVKSGKHLANWRRPRVYYLRPLAARARSECGAEKESSFARASCVPV
jgi:hypothetical protein